MAGVEKTMLTVRTRWVRTIGAALSGGWTEGKAPYAHARDASVVPPRELLPDRSGTALWPVWDTTLHLVVTSPDRLVDARRLVIHQVAAIDDACNPLRSDSEVRALQRARDQPVRVSPLLAELVAVSLRAARLSDGDVDPIARGVVRERDQELFRTPPYRGGIDAPEPPALDWRSIRQNGRQLTVPAGGPLDLSAMARAHAVDRCTRLIYKRFKVGVLVGIGGDIATAGQAPAGGWGTRIPANPGGPGIPVHLPSTALATSSAVSRRWPGDGRPLGYPVRPETSRPDSSVWCSISVAAFECTYARALSMGAMMRGHAAPAWLRGLGVSARLVAADGAVVIVGRWPAEEAP
jgi:FAD:protein FMN transferase